VGDGTVLDALVTAVAAAAEYDRNDQAAPAVVLWTDKGREWEPLLPALRARLPVLTYGVYDGDVRQGPAIWLRCALAGAAEGAEAIADRTPVVYLPGVGRDDLRSVADLDESLQPLAELQYRGVFFSHPNGRDWTVAGFLRNREKGLGLSVKESAETLTALRQALGELVLEPVSSLCDRELDAGDFHALLQPDATKSVLQWIDDAQGFRQTQSEEQWAAFRAACTREWDLDPETDGELSAAERLGEREGSWAKVWDRFAEAPERYPHVPERLRVAMPQQLVIQHPESWPQVNEDAERRLRAVLASLGDAQPDVARSRLHELEREHCERRAWLWADFGQAPLAASLEHLVALAAVTSESWKTGSLEEIAAQYASSGWRADDALLRALAAVEGIEDAEAVRAAADVLYRVWLQKGAEVLQEAATAEDWPAAFDAGGVPSSTCVLFSDGLRYDLGERLKDRLVTSGCECELASDFAALPPVTSSAKPAVSPVAGRLGGGPDFDPSPSGGSSRLGAEAFRAFLREAGWQVLGPAEGGDPSGRAWTELGDIDKYGHDFGWKLARAVDGMLHEIAQRVTGLLKYGWQRVVVVTDHGWLLVPGGLQKVDLPEHLTEKRKGRCARIKGTSTVDFLTLPWRWDPQVHIAYAPGIATFVAGAEYYHGGLSTQECVVPTLTVTLAAAHALAVTLESVVWTGLRCRAKLAGGAPGMSLDVRSKAADAGSSLVMAKPVDEHGEASVLVADDARLGEAALVVVLAEDGTVVKQQTTVVGGEE